MGIYSLENYEKYKTTIIRPRPLAEAPSNFGRGQINYIEFSWSELEPKRGEYHLEAIDNELNHTENSVLLLDPKMPLWAGDHAVDFFAAFVRKIGSYIGGDQRLIGAVIKTLANSKEEWDAYIESFDRTYIFVDLYETKLVSYLKNKKLDFGLLVRCNEENWLECCEVFAKHNLQNTWKKSPVLIHNTDKDCGLNIKREALRWHGSLSNLSMDLGYNFTLKRLTYPETVSSNGALPIRFWFVNTGSSRAYEPLKLRLQLKQEDMEYEIPLNAVTESWLTGDITYNEIVKLPDIEPGHYSVSIGLFSKDKRPVNLNIEGNVKDGFYELGTIEIDRTNRDELFNIWDTYYPEGYYPLEDPKTPDE